MLTMALKFEAVRSASPTKRRCDENPSHGLKGGRRIVKNIPQVFISAASRDLRNCREDVRQVLARRGVKPVLQEGFTTTHLEISEKLTRAISSCDAAIFLVGFAYGDEPTGRPAGVPRRSYSQMEYDIAEGLGIDVFLFLTADTSDFPLEQEENEDVRSLQEAHRNKLRSNNRDSKTFTSRQQLREEVALIEFNWVPVPGLGMRLLHRATTALANGLSSIKVFCLRHLRSISEVCGVLCAITIAVYFVPVFGLGTVLEVRDPGAFSGTAKGKYHIARAFEDRIELQKDSNLAIILGETKQSFDVFSLNAPSFADKTEAIESAIKRGVFFRILLVDHGEANHAKLADFFKDCGRSDFNLKTSIDESNRSKKKFVTLHKEAPKSGRGGLEIRWWKGIYLNSFWVRDCDGKKNMLTPTSVGHLEITYFGPSRSQDPSVRFGEFSHEIVLSLQKQFDYMWDKSETLSKDLP